MRRRPIRAPWEGEFMKQRQDHIKIIKDPIIRCIHTNDEYFTLYVEQYIKNQKGQLCFWNSYSLNGMNAWHGNWVQWHADWVFKVYGLNKGKYTFLKRYDYDLKGKNVQIVLDTKDWEEAGEWLGYCKKFQKETGCKLFIASDEFNRGHFSNQNTDQIIKFTETYNKGVETIDGIGVPPDEYSNSPIHDLYARYDIGRFPLTTKKKYGFERDQWRVDDKDKESSHNSITFKQQNKLPLGLIEMMNFTFDGWKNPVTISQSQLDEYYGIVDKDVEIEEATSADIVKQILGFKTKYWDGVDLKKEGHRKIKGEFTQHEFFSGGFHSWGKGENATRVAIQILSYNKPYYLKRTLDSLMEVIEHNDKICVLEQSNKSDLKEQAIDVCKEYDNITIISIDENLGQRGATNKVWESGFFDNCQYIMFSDHDNEYHEPLTILCDKLDEENNVTIATFYNSPEHDITHKDGNWLYKQTARAGNMMMRRDELIQMLPIDVDLYSETKTDEDYCAWFAGLDWWVQWGHDESGGKQNRDNFVACYMGGCTHFGVESTWQGKYDDEIPRHESLLMKDKTMEQIVKKYPPRREYNHGKEWWYEKEKLDLKDVTLVIVDCIDYERALRAVNISTIYAKFGDVKFFTSMDKDNDDIVKIPHCQSNFDVIHFMWKKMNSYIKTKYILHIEFDGFILNPKAWKDEFLNYDYIGAPWWYEENNVGNAGFSLISKKMLDFIQKDDVMDLYPSDDDAICRINRKYLEENGIKFAPEELAADFSFEANEKRGDKWDGQFGFHSPSMENERHPNKFRGGITNIDNWPDKDKIRWPNG